MKTKTIFLSVATLLSLLISEKATAQIGEPYIHDPSTIMECEGRNLEFEIMDMDRGRVDKLLVIKRNDEE